MYDSKIGRWISEDPLGFQIPGSPIQSHYTLAGRQQGVEAELQNNRAPSYYDPASGGWVNPEQRSRYGESNLYRYVNNMPTRATDPSGLEIWIVGTYDASSGYGHSSIVVFDPVTKTGFKYDGRGPRQDRWFMGYQAWAFRQKYPELYLREGNKDPLNEGQTPHSLWTVGTIMKVDTGKLTFKQESQALQSAWGQLVQVDIYNTSGPNSNTYARQLLTLASQNAPVPFTVPRTIDDTPGWDYSGPYRYGGLVYDEFGRFIQPPPPRPPGIRAR